MIKLLRIIGIAAMLGFVAAGVTWLGWDAAGALRRAWQRRRLRRKQAADAAALMTQTREPAVEGASAKKKNEGA
ncbi:MAG TPA: hypothetical protein ENN65_06505 [Candidatus Hydrogenedentes bacterium]|nr:hypothetical protein [Candidatus Hydrogenedentota bacterium]